MNRTVHLSWHQQNVCCITYFFDNQWRKVGKHWKWTHSWCSLYKQVNIMFFWQLPTIHAYRNTSSMVTFYQKLFTRCNFKSTIRAKIVSVGCIHCCVEKWKEWPVESYLIRWWRAKKLPRLDHQHKKLLWYKLKLKQILSRTLKTDCVMWRLFFVRYSWP